MRTWVLGLTGLGLTCACGAAPAASPLASTRPAPEPEPPVNTASVSEKVDVSFVIPRPREAWQRWRHLAALGIPGAHFFELDALAARTLGPEFAGAVDWDAPMAGAFLSDGAGAIFGATLNDFEAARAAIEDLPSLQRIGVRFAFEAPLNEGAFRCELWPQGVLERPAVLCADRSGVDLREYAPAIGAWMAVSDTADVRVDLSKLRAELIEEIEKEPPSEDPADVLLSRTVLDTVRDVRTLAVGLTHTGRSITARLDVSIAGRAPVLLRAALGDPGRHAPGAPPALPDDAEFVWSSGGYSPGNDGSERAEVIAMLQRMAATQPPSVFDPAGAEPSARAWADVMLTGGRWHFAHGADVPAVERVLASGSRPEGADLVEEFRKARRSWFLLAFPEAEPSFLARVQHAIAVDTPYTPVPAALPSFTAEPWLPSASVLTIEPLPEKHGLPEDSLHIVQTIIPNTAYVPRPSAPQVTRAQTHWFVALVDGQAWAAGSKDATVALARLRSVIGKPDARPSPAVPHPGSASTQQTFAGYASLSAFPLLSTPETEDGLAALATTMRTLRTLPGGASRRLPFGGAVRQDPDAYTMQVFVEFAEDFALAAVLQLVETQ